MAAPDRPRTSGRLALLALAVGITATIVAWGVLVLAAIDFGRDARAGSSNGWLFLGAASLGAVACLFLAIIFASKLQARVREPRTPAPPPARPVSDETRSEATVEAVGPTPDVVELDDEGLPPAEAAPEEAPTYRSRHSRAAIDPATADTEDSPAAQYRGKRAAR